MARVPNPAYLIQSILLSALLFNWHIFPGVHAKGIVADLSDEYFKEGLVDYNHAFVLFYSQKCVHCKDFMPIFSMAADELIRNEPPVHSAMVDCDDVGKTVCRDERVQQLPTMKIYRRGTLYDEYEGARTVEDIVAYLKKLVGITSLELPLNQLEEFANSQNEVVVIGVLKTKGNLRDNYFSLPAELSKDIRFGHVTVEEHKLADLNISYGVTMYHPDHMRNKFEPWQFTYDTINEGYDLLEFISEYRYGLVGLRGIRNVDDFAPPLVIVYMKIDLKLNVRMFSYWRNRSLKVAKEYEKFFNFAISPIDDFQHEFAKFGIPLPNEDKRDFPLVFAILADNSKYLMEEEFSTENFNTFLKNVLNGTAELHLKSQPIPETVFKKGMVQTIVAKNFENIVWDSEDDVLLEFFAPWCTSCKALGDVLDKVAKNLGNDHIVICKMDATQNEIPANFANLQFPTLYFIPKKDKHNHILYQGGANLDEVNSFIAECRENDKMKKEEL